MVEWRSVEVHNTWWKNPESYTLLDPDLSVLLYQNGGLERTTIRSLLEPGTIHFIKGPRRVGKTVYLKKMVKELLEKKLDKHEPLAPRAILFYSAEAKTAQELINTLQTYFDLHYGYPHYVILIDEITSIKEIDGKKGWASSLKAWYDQGKFKNTTLVLTGSDANLLEQGRKVLLGRGKAEENLHFLLPLTFRDFLLSTLSNEIYRQESIKILRPGVNENNVMWGLEKKMMNEFFSLIANKNSINQPDGDIHVSFQTYGRFSGFLEVITQFFSLYIQTSGFPQSIAQHIVEKKVTSLAWYSTLISEILENLGLSDLSAITAEKILIKLAERQGTTVSYKSLADEVGVSPPTVERYIRVLENLHLILAIHNYNPGTETHLKKIYITDPLLFYVLLSKARGIPIDTIIKETIANEMEMAKLIEALVGNSLFLSMQRQSEDHVPLYFKNPKKGKEIDFLVIRSDNKTVGIEVKYQNEITKSDVPWNQEVDYYLVITKNSLVRFNENALAVPVSLFLATLSKSPLFL